MCNQASVIVQPCYLCKQTGHTTMTCPYRIAPEHGCVQAANLSSDTLLATVLQREHHGRSVAGHSGTSPFQGCPAPGVVFHGTCSSFVVLLVNAAALLMSCAGELLPMLEVMQEA